ncbi:unnamed protein product [Hymenolepis diminuta]|uniref:Uncharacterized protein n=1 Tax=Hymenolepis diminuta TaxID=6216 RepID=A0A564Y2U8_HYMDI|nr:unnamed protein product [Hymenolepis diminuta]
MLAFNSMPSFFNSIAMGRNKKGHTSERVGTSIAEYTGFLSSQMGPTPLAFERAFRLPHMNFHPEAFFSIQLEKSICRDRVMNVYAKKTQATAKSKSGSSNESEKLKRDLISQFCDDYSKRTQQTALRAQIIALYASLLTILKNVPNIW